MIALTPEQREAAMSATKLGTAWGSVWIGQKLSALGIDSWGELAAAAAAIYSICLIAEFVWKKVVKPFLQWGRLL